MWDDGSSGAGASLLAIGQTRYELRAAAFIRRELEVISFQGVERLNAPFEYDVTFATSVDDGTLQGELFGFPACLSIYVPGHDPRVIQGIVVHLEAVGDASRANEVERRVYLLRIAPPLAVLGLTKTFRVFEDKTAIQITTTVLAAANITASAFGHPEALPKLPFVYQRGESDLDFVNQVLATAGIFYYFEHANAFPSALSRQGGGEADAPSKAVPQTRLVFCDATRDTEAMSDAGGAGGSGRTVGYRGGDTLAYDPHGHDKEAEHVVDFRVRKQLRPGSARVQDWDIRENKPADWVAAGPKPECSVKEDVHGQTLHKVEGFNTDTLATAQKADARKVTEYQRDAGALAVAPEAYYARRVLTQLRADWIVAQGKSDCARLAPGYRFSLAGHPVASINGEYLVTEVRSSGANLDHAGLGARDVPEAQGYRNEFVCVPASVDPMPPKPQLSPPLAAEAAEVIGPEPGEINTDETGRIQVRFHWAPPNGAAADPLGGVCWANWLERWGGDGYGTVTIPRVGSEVWIEFPQRTGDTPIAVGQLYSTVNHPPWELPKEASKVGIRTHKLQGGDAYSEISIDDKGGSECVNVRAQKDMIEEVIADQTITVGKKHTMTVKDDRTLSFEKKEDTTIGTGRTTTIKEGGDSLTVKDGDRTVEVSQGNHTATIKQTDKTECTDSKIHASATLEHLGDTKVRLAQTDAYIEFEAGHSDMTVKDWATFTTAAGSISLKDSKVTVTAKEELVLTCGESSISLKSDGTIAITGSQKVTITSGESTIDLSPAKVAISGTQIEVSGQATAKIEAIEVQVSGTATTTVKGAIVSVQGTLTKLG